MFTWGGILHPDGYYRPSANFSVVAHYVLFLIQEGFFQMWWYWNMYSFLQILNSNVGLTLTGARESIAAAHLFKVLIFQSTFLLLNGSIY